MTDRPGFSDQDLSAYLDDEAPAELSAAIRSALQSDPALRARLEELQAGQEAFVTAMEEVLQSAPTMPELPRAVTHSQRVWPLGLAGVAAGAALALGLGWSGIVAPDPGWRDVVANYQSLYVTETLAPVALTPQEQQADLQRVSEGLGLDLSALPQVAGLTYKRAQQLGYKGQPLAQLTFLTAEGGPVALCILRTGSETSPGITAEVLSGLDTYSWSEDGFGILLVGPRGETGLENAAKIFRAALKKTAA